MPQGLPLVYTKAVRGLAALRLRTAIPSLASPLHRYSMPLPSRTACCTASLG